MGRKRAGKVKQKKLTFSANIPLYYMNSASIYTLELVWQICFSAGCSMGPYPETWMTFSLTHQRKNILSIKVWFPSLLGFEQGVLPPHIPSSLVAGAIKPFKCKNALSIWTTSGNDKESPSPPPSFQPHFVVSIWATAFVSVDCTWQLLHTHGIRQKEKPGS